jgi:hypothetical protein
VTQLTHYVKVPWFGNRHHLRTGLVVFALVSSAAVATGCRDESQPQSSGDAPYWCLKYANNPSDCYP